MKNPIMIMQFIYQCYQVIKNPRRLDALLDCTDNLTKKTSRKNLELFESMKKKCSLEKFFERRKPLDLPSIEESLTLPEETLGHQYANFMKQNKIKPNSLIVKNYDSDMTYYKHHIRGSHDLWHVVTGFDTSISGEVGLQAFYSAQLPSFIHPFIIALMLFHTSFYAIEDRNKFFSAIIQGWSYGKRAKDFFGTDWKKLWETPLNEVRKNLAM